MAARFDGAVGACGGERKARTFSAVGVIATRCAIFLAALAAIAGCAAHANSTLRVDGSRFVPAICQSGQTRGFVGVELVDEQQRRLRLAEGVDGGLQVVYLPPGAAVGEHLGDCGTIRLEAPGGAVNGVKNVAGQAELSCVGGQYQVTGHVSFEGCH